jgi:hypothetical protein
MLSSEVIYGGVKYKKVRHAVMCKICKVTLESLEVHDYKVCSCGSVAIDNDRLIGSLTNMEDRSVYSAKVAGKTIWLPEHLTPQKESLAEKVYTCAKL